MISSKSEYTVTCKYCDFVRNTPDKDFAEKTEQTHKEQCPVLLAARKVSKTPGEFETFLLGVAYYDSTQ